MSCMFVKKISLINVYVFLLEDGCIIVYDVICAWYVSKRI
jgi:hypothetical protein